MSSEEAAEPRLCATVEAAFEILSRKWLGLIVHVLSGGEKHFCELERALPQVSARMLATRMKDLESAGLVERRVHTQSPVRVTYELTPRGKELVPIMASVAEWAQRANRPKARATR